MEERELVEILTSEKGEEMEGERKLRMVMAKASLYYSFSLLKQPVMGTDVAMQKYSKSYLRSCLCCRTEFLRR